MQHDDILSMEEIGRLVRIMSLLGISKVRLTGGEPLVHRGLIELIRILRDDCHMQKIAMTSNGMLLGKSGSRHGKSGYSAQELKDAGLTSLNISLDTLNPGTFRKLTGVDGLDEVKRGIESAISSGLDVKLNCVPIKGVNDDELSCLVSYAENMGVMLRFIELMPIGCGLSYEGVPTDDIVSILEDEYGTSYEVTDKKERVSGDPQRVTCGPATYRVFEKCNVPVGFISPISHKFCDRCNRIRLMASGFLKLCLQYPDGVDLKAMLRKGAGDEEIANVIMTAVSEKPAAHSFGVRGEATDKRKMIQIGG